MSLKRRAFILAVIGYLLSVIVGELIPCIICTIQKGDGNLYLCSELLIELYGTPLKAFIMQGFISGFIGGVAMGTTVVYKIDEWSLIKQTVVHYLVTMVTYYIVAFLLRWLYPTDYVSNIIIFVMMTVAYVFIWLINYLTYKKQLKEINEDLNEIKSLDDKENNDGA